MTIESEIGVGTRIAGMVPVRRNGGPEAETASEPALGMPDAV